ncbi:MAG: glycosyltransferase family 2 protein [Oscillospiraceae bacterium]|nr:glycosyltransferase family 2 protein [Oscillospiraceae bacterium]
MKITVFTPTYNRAYILEKLYRSLQKQTCRDFEWLVVDDGSADETQELFRKWEMEENSFSIRYFKTENGGKCRAINHGLKLARGELFFTVDSDDTLTEDALEKVISWEAALPSDGRYCGIAGNPGTSDAYTPNRLFDGGYFDGTLLDRYGSVDGERAIVFYTQIYRNYLYPEFEGEKFLTEAVVYNRMAHDGYRMRFYNDIIYIYEYRNDGLTKAGRRLFLDNPRGYGLWLREKAEFENASRIDKLKMYYTFTCDLSAQYDDSSMIAECIGAPEMLVRFIIMARKLLKKG